MIIVSLIKHSVSVAKFQTCWIDARAKMNGFDFAALNCLHTVSRCITADHPNET
jgi:hypothetical protein